MKLTITYDDDNGDEQEFELPAKYEVCERCEGHGTHLNPSIGQHAYSAEEFSEAFDHEEREQYFKRGGIYDVPCERCAGKRVVAVIDEAACCSDDEKRHLAIYHERQERLARDAAERAAELRMGY